jgi:uncharacterized protein YndB with AHSA1/START domain
MAAELTNTIEIGCPAEALYRYVTQPWRWHEWHPNSLAAQANADVLAAGDRFEEEIELQPFSPLPYRMRRRTNYTVLVAEPFRRWQARGEARDGWLEIRYAFEDADGATRFTRTLVFETRGLSALLMPFLRGRMSGMSERALRNLKDRMESPGGPC